MNIKLLIKQFTFPLSLILLCYINLQYMHYSILIDKYSLTPVSYTHLTLPTTPYV